MTKNVVAPKASTPKKNKVASDDFAVIETGGKQYIVCVGDILDIELLDGEHKEGDKVIFDKVLMSDDGKNATIGTPGAKVTGSYIGPKKGKKISIIRYKAKSNRDRNVGHRQKYSQVKIEAI